MKFLWAVCKHCGCAEKYHRRARNTCKRTHERMSERIYILNKNIYSKTDSQNKSKHKFFFSLFVNIFSSPLEYSWSTTKKTWKIKTFIAFRVIWLAIVNFQFKFLSQEKNAHDINSLSHLFKKFQQKCIDSSVVFSYFIIIFANFMIQMKLFPLCLPMFVFLYSSTEVIISSVSHCYYHDSFVHLSSQL